MVTTSLSDGEDSVAHLSYYRKAAKSAAVVAVKVFPKRDERDIQALSSDPIIRTQIEKSGWLGWLCAGHKSKAC